MLGDGRSEDGLANDTVGDGIIDTVNEQIGMGLDHGEWGVVMHGNGPYRTCAPGGACGGRIDRNRVAVDGSDGRRRFGAVESISDDRAGDGC